MALAMVCEACQQNKHGACGDPGTCICALRGHPHIQQGTGQANP